MNGCGLYGLTFLAFLRTSVSERGSNLFKGFTGLYLLSQSFFVDCDFLSSFASSRVSWTQYRGGLSFEIFWVGTGSLMGMEDLN